MNYSLKKTPSRDGQFLKFYLDSFENKTREEVLKGKFYDELQGIDKVIEELKSKEKEEYEQEKTE